MRELGRRGGKVSPQTRLRTAADDDLREQARETLSRALRGEEVAKSALDAARSLAQAAAGSGVAPPVDEMNHLLMGLVVASQRSFQLLARRIEDVENA